MDEPFSKIMEYMTFSKLIVQFDVREGRVSAGNASLYADRNDASSFGKCIAADRRCVGTRRDGSSRLSSSSKPAELGLADPETPGSLRASTAQAGVRRHLKNPPTARQVITVVAPS
jgi:hypothetical protein